MMNGVQHRTAGVVDQQFTSFILRCRRFASLVAAVIAVVVSTPALSATPTYNQGMTAFSSGNYKSSEALFSKCMREDSENASAAYMDALSLQRLGNVPRATALYRSICDKFPDSAACIRAQAALSTLDPAFLRRWKAAHPEPVQGMGIPPLGVNGISPDFSYGTKPLTVAEQNYYRQKLLSGSVIRCRVGGAWTEVQLNNKLPYSYLGFNWLRESGLNFNPKARVYSATVQIDHVRCANFEFRMQDRISVPIQLGKDFERIYLHNVLMANPQSAIAYHQPSLGLSNSTSSSSSGTGPVLDPLLADKENTFEIPYKADSGHKIISVQVDNSSVDMILGESGITSMGPDQLRAINPSYVPELTAMKQEVTVPNTTIRNSATVKLGLIRVGKILRRDCPCMVESFSSFRYQASGGSPRDYPLVGADVFETWDWHADERRQVIVFMKKKS
jgi:hypothetical protein